jgi:hypothetical protein
MNCFRCGDDDHLSRDCPPRTRPARAPDPAPGLTPAPSNRPEDKPIPERRDPSEIADPGAWADTIRRTEGWEAGAREVMTRGMAARQLAEDAMRTRRSDRTGAQIMAAVRTSWRAQFPNDPPGAY